MLEIMAFVVPLIILYNLNKHILTLNISGISKRFTISQYHLKLFLAVSSLNSEFSFVFKL